MPREHLRALLPIATSQPHPARLLAASRVTETLLVHGMPRINSTKAAVSEFQARPATSKTAVPVAPQWLSATHQQQPVHKISTCAHIHT